MSVPDRAWYEQVSQERNVTLRCPFATVEMCPRYFQSLSLLGDAGSTKISDSEEKRLNKHWLASDLWPRTDEQRTSICGEPGNPSIFTNFCPEVAFERFGYFATLLARHSDEIDSDSAHKALMQKNTPSNHPGWVWASCVGQHFTECPLYSVLFVRLQSQASVASEKTEHVAATYPEIVTTNSKLVIKRLNAIIKEWEMWGEEVSRIIDQPYDRNTQSDVFKDGEDMMHKHEILQMKTLAYLNKHIKSHGFITGFDGSHCDRTDLRLNHRVKHRLQELRVLKGCLYEIGENTMQAEVTKPLSTTNCGWKQIETDYGVSKKAFGKKISFIRDDFKRKVIFRDIEHAYCLANAGYNKPAVILAGGVTEELLRLYLIHNQVSPSDKTFDSYIKACEAKGLLKKAVHRLSDSFRHFRNFVHLSNETTAKHTISIATAKGAVASIFTLANDF